MKDAKTSVPRPERDALIDAIPHPQEIREQIGDALRETKLLRQLLRVAEMAERERLNQKGGCRAN